MVPQIKPRTTRQSLKKRRDRKTGKRVYTYKTRHYSKNTTITLIASEFMQSLSFITSKWKSYSNLWPFKIKFTKLGTKLLIRLPFKSEKKIGKNWRYTRRNVNLSNINVKPITFSGQKTKRVHSVSNYFILILKTGHEKKSPFDWERLL